MCAPLRRLIGGLTLLLFVGSLLVPVLTASHLAGDDDPACATDAMVPGHRTAQIDDSGPHAPARHCAVCHWLRAVASAAIRVPTVVDHGPVTGPLAVRSSSPAPDRLPVAGLSTRGPPTSLL